MDLDQGKRGHGGITMGWCGWMRMPTSEKCEYQGSVDHHMDIDAVCYSLFVYMFVDFGSDMESGWAVNPKTIPHYIMEISSTISKCITNLASLCLRLFRGLWSCDVLPLSSLLELPPKMDWFPASTKSGASLLRIVFCTIRNEYPLLV